jgi:F-type H+-transporting ATPase subunit delta
MTTGASSKKQPKPFATESGMKITRQTRRNATKLFRACLIEGSLDGSRVRRAVQQVITSKPRSYLETLFLFRRLVRLELAGRIASVESARPLPPEVKTDVEKDLADAYGGPLTTSYSENPALIAGMRIKIGSDVYDGTVAGRLNTIEQSFQAL